MNPKNPSELEKDCRKSLMESFIKETEGTFPSRLKIYQQKSGNILQKEEKYTLDMIDSYLKLMNYSDDSEQKKEFDRLSRINESFLEYLKKEDQGGTTTANIDSHRRFDEESPNKNFAYSVSPNRTISGNGQPFNPELYKELKKFENERLQKLGALVSDDNKTPKFSELETANLLRGIYKYGESNWNNILTEEKFDKDRTVNQLILKWRMIKIFMKGELDSMNVKRQKLITRNDWILAAIKALEKRNKVNRDLPPNVRKSYEQPFFRNTEAGAKGEHGGFKPFSHDPNNPDNIPSFLIKKPSGSQNLHSIVVYIH